MDDDYLWDRKGEPDAEVARLERALAPLRVKDRAYDAAAPVVPLRSKRSRPWWILTAAALAATALLIVRERRAEQPTARTDPRQAPAGQRLSSAPPTPPAAFAVERIEGTPRVNDAPLTATGKLNLGEWLETDPGSRARIAVADIGTVELSGKSRVRFAATGAQHRLELQQGSLSAVVDAPPRLFVVATPAATAVDLGCAYTLDVDEDGRGTLHVTSGWVSLEDRSRVSLVPAGARCETRRGKGPGTPTYEDAPAALRDALSRFDFADGGPAALDLALAAARPRDALTVWHLIPRVEGALRVKVRDRLHALSPSPGGTDADAVLLLDAAALDRWRRSIVAGGASITW